MFCSYLPMYTQHQPLQIWTFVLDSAGEARNAYEISSYPTSLFLDAKGVIVRVLRGSRNYETFLEATRQAINN